jgi:hypothetical protein
MKHLLATSFLILIAAALPAFAANPCTLDRSVLAAYDRPNATLEEMAASRRAVSAFMGCDPADIDPASRKVFFAVVQREFRHDPKPHLDAWKTTHPGSDALWDGINTYQAELRDYLGRAFEPARDKEFMNVVIQYGKAKTIANLGPAAKAAVTRSLGTPRSFYGIANLHNSQVEALEALGYWIDPANPSFTPVEKYELAQILTGLLDVSENVAGPHHERVVGTALRSLAHSDDAHALTRVEAWAGKRKDKDDPLSRTAARTIAEMKRRQRRN